MEELAQLGATVYTCSRNEQELNQKLQEWSSKGFKVSGSVCDASDKEQRMQLIQKVSSAFDGKLNFLVSLSKRFHLFYFFASRLCTFFLFYFSILSNQ